jgi:hypothetical protein
MSDYVSCLSHIWRRYSSLGPGSAGTFPTIRRCDENLIALGGNSGDNWSILVINQTTRDFLQYV